MDTAEFGTLNYLILATYLAGMLGIGVFFSRNRKMPKCFFSAGAGCPGLR